MFDELVTIPAKAAVLVNSIALASAAKENFIIAPIASGNII